MWCWWGHKVLYYVAYKGMIRSSTVWWLVWFGTVVMIHIVYWCELFVSHWVLIAPILQKYNLWENFPTQCVYVVHRRGWWLHCWLCNGGDLWIDRRIGSRNSLSAKCVSKISRFWSLLLRWWRQCDSRSWILRSGHWYICIVASSAAWHQGQTLDVAGTVLSLFVKQWFWWPVFCIIIMSFT